MSEKLILVSRKPHPVIVGLLFWTWLAWPVFAQQDPGLKAIEAAIQKAETNQPDSMIKGTGVYQESYLIPILIEINKYFSPVASRGLQATLNFMPHYREPVGQTKTIRRPASTKSNHQPISQYETVVVQTTPASKVIDYYKISGGDEAVLKQVSTRCFVLSELVKNTSLLSKNACLKYGVLRCFNTLLNNLPTFSAKYLDVDGVPAHKYEARLAEVEQMRSNLQVVYKEYATEMGKWKRKHGATDPGTDE